MAEMIAKVTQEGDSVENSLVELSNGLTTVSGKVAAESVDEFLVNWEDGSRSVENKSDYELVVTAAPAKPEHKLADEPMDIGEVLWSGEIELKDRKAAKTAQENPAQPAGWAVPPMDANAYPGGELMAIEQEKRGETAQWEDAQNRPPVDAENPAQPAGFAVPPATGGPIPGQGADAMQVAARVYADDITGEKGLVELSKGNVRVAGKVLAADDETMIVEWEDERRTVESKADYDLVITSDSAYREASDKTAGYYNKDGKWVSTWSDTLRQFHQDNVESERRRNDALTERVDRLLGTTACACKGEDGSCVSCGGSGWLSK